jgi:hypothetical protein
MAAYLADPTAEVHYPLKTPRWPKTTLEVPEWKYHRVDAQLLDSIVEFDVPRERILSNASMLEYVAHCHLESWYVLVRLCYELDYYRGLP